MKRIRHLFNTLKTNWSAEPAARGAAKMTAGAILVAEGLFGVVSGMASQARRFSPGGDTKSIGGLLGHLIVCAIGIVFFLVGSHMSPTDYPDQVLVSGKVAEVESQRDKDGKTAYRAVYSFQAGDREYSFHSIGASNVQPKIGEPVKIAYSAADPNQCRRLDGIEGRMHWIFLGSGALMLVFGFFGLAVSLALIGFGVWLFLQGRKDRRSVNASGGFIPDLMSLAKQARSGAIDINRTAVGLAGGGQGDIDLFSLPDQGGAAPSSSPTPPPTTSLPPAGWYADPDGTSQQRWWDGAQWSDHRQ
jgi:hypothetical protein